MDSSAKIISARDYLGLARVLQKDLGVAAVAVRDSLGLWHGAPAGEVKTHYRGLTLPVRKGRVAFSGANRKAKTAYRSQSALVALKLETLDLAERVKRLKLIATSEEKYAQSALRQAYSRAESRFEKKLELFGRYSHDLKTPFSMLVSSLENMILEEEDVPVRLKLRLEKLRTAVYSVLRTAGQSLDAARLLTRRKTATLIPFNFTAFVREILEVYAIVFESYGIRLETDLQENIPARIDPIQMEKVINNLLSNAIKHNIPGGLAHVSLAEKAGKIELTIADTGLGMAETETVKDLNPWRFPSHGYGLNIVRELVRANRGKLRFRSEGGVGTTVSVLLPAQRDLRPVVTSLRNHNFQTTLYEVEFLASERTRLSRRKKTA